MGLVVVFVTGDDGGASGEFGVVVNPVVPVEGEGPSQLEGDGPPLHGGGDAEAALLDGAVAGGDDAVLSLAGGGIRPHLHQFDAGLRGQVHAGLDGVGDGDGPAIRVVPL